MKRIVFGVVIGVCTFVAGVGLDRLIAGAYSSIWPQIPAVDVEPDTNIYDVEICEQLREPGVYDGKIVRLKMRPGSVGATYAALYSSGGCRGFIFAECPNEAACDALPIIVGKPSYVADAMITGLFRAREVWENPAIEIQEIAKLDPEVKCWDGSVVNDYDKCPAYPSADIRVNGISIGSTYSQVIRAFGKPLKKNTESVEEADWSRMILEYRGLTLTLWSDVDGKNFSVGEITVTSRKWNVSGARVGDSAAVVTERFGRPVVSEDGNTISYVDANNEGSIEFTVADGKINAILFVVDGC